MILPGVVVVGTGRCGSTLLSNLLRDHEDVLSLFEFWPNRLNLTELFDTKQVSGEQYWRLLSLPIAGDIYRIALAAKMSQVPSRTLHETNLMRRIALSSIVEDYDELFERIAAHMQARPIATAADHVRSMFSFIASALGKKVWVERTGASLAYLPKWKHMWPDTRFVHIFRDGRDAAQSMSKHHAFRLMIARAKSDPESSWLNVRPLDTASLDVEAFLGRQIPLAEFGCLWNGLVVDGIKELQSLPEANQYWLRYEDLVADPIPQLSRLLGFIAPELDARPWALRCATKLKRPRSDWRMLETKILVELESSCREGLRLLGYERALEA